MSLDFTALAGSLAVGVPGVRACLFVSGDGLALASHPASQEAAALAAWARLSELGPLERGFVAMEHENWVFSKRSDYSGLVITDPAVRPGVLLDRLEQALQLADESRSRHEGMTPVPGVVPMSASAKEPSRPARRIRLPVHREAPRSVPEPELVEAERRPTRPIARPAPPPAALPPPAEPPPSRTPRDVPAEDQPRDEADTRAPREEAPDSRPARAAKPAARGRRGLGEYVGKQAKGGGGSRPTGRREQKPGANHPGPADVEEAPRAHEAGVAPAEASPTDTAEETERVEVIRDEPRITPRDDQAAPPARDPEGTEPPERTWPPQRLDADLETLLSSRSEPPPAAGEPIPSQGAMLDAVSAALEAPGKAAEESVSLPEARAERAAEPEPVAEESQPEVAEAPAPEPVVAETPQPEPADAEAAQPEPVVDVTPEPEPEHKPELVSEPEPQPEPQPVVAEAVPPAVAADAVEEAKAAMWRRRMKSKPGAGKRDDSRAAPEPRAGEEAADKEPAGPEAEQSEEPATDGEKKSSSDVDVVALAREFSGLFGDEGREG